MREKYDVVIIGAGIAGLSAGLYLQKMGKRSLILEHGSQVGGNMCGGWRKGFYFDYGDQSTENVGVLFTLLEELGLYDPDEWLKIDFRYASRDFSIPLKDYDQIREDFKKVFPESSTGLDKWFDMLTPTGITMKDMMGSGPFPFALDGLEKWRANFKTMRTSAPMARSMRELMFKTGDEKAMEFFDDPRLVFLFGEYGCLNMFLMYHISFWYTFLYDYWYPKAGIQALMNKLADAYQERGGEIHLKSTVDKVLTTGGRVTAVETSQGERFSGDHVVNTGNPKRLLNQMLDDPNQWDYKERQRILSGEVSRGQTAALLGVDISNQELRKYLKEHHTHYFRTYETAVRNPYDPELHNKGWSMISATSLHLPHLAPEGKSSIVVQVFTPYHWQNGWGTGSADPFARGAKHKELNEKVLNDIIRETEYIIPGLSDKIVHKELASPRTLARYTLNEEGSPQGWSYDIYRCNRAYKFARFRTPIKNLFMAGHYAMWPGGVIFSALSGRIVAKGIYGGFWRQLLY